MAIRSTREEAIFIRRSPSFYSYLRLPLHPLTEALDKNFSVSRIHRVVTFARSRYVYVSEESWPRTSVRKEKGKNLKKKNRKVTLHRTYIHIYLRKHRMRFSRAILNEGTKGKKSRRVFIFVALNASQKRRRWVAIQVHTDRQG